jgi:hypothetical protein
MFKSLFHSGRVLARHINSPLAAERSTFLTHLSLVGISRSTLLRHARQLRVIALLLDKQVPGHVTLELIGQCAQASPWNQINWPKCERHARRLQARIVKVARRDNRREPGSVSAGLCIGLSRMRGNSHVRF